METIIQQKLEENEGDENIECLQTALPFMISIREYRLHQQAASEGKVTLTNLFYAYSEEALAEVKGFLAKLQPGDGYSEELFKPRAGNGFPADTRWTSI